MGDLSYFEIAVMLTELLVVTIGGTIFSILAYRRSMLDAIWQWTQLDGSQEVIAARRFVQYELPDGYDPQDIRNNINKAAEKIAPVNNAYNHLGMLVRRRYIPASTFRNNSTGNTIVMIYEKLMPYIAKVRQEHNPYYASDFQYLYNKVKAYYNP